MARTYFRVVQTMSANDPAGAATTHAEKLNNFNDFTEDFGDKVCSQSTASTMQNHGFVITTTLHIEKKEEVEEERENG